MNMTASAVSAICRLYLQQKDTVLQGETKYGKKPIYRTGAGTFVMAIRGASSSTRSPAKEVLLSLLRFKLQKDTFK